MEMSIEEIIERAKKQLPNAKNYEADFIYIPVKKPSVVKLVDVGLPIESSFYEVTFRKRPHFTKKFYWELINVSN